MCQTVDKRVKICRELREERDEDEGFKGEWECGKLKKKKRQGVKGNTALIGKRMDGQKHEKS